MTKYHPAAAESPARSRRSLISRRTGAGWYPASSAASMVVIHLVELRSSCIAFVRQALPHLVKPLGISRIEIIEIQEGVSKDLEASADSSPWRFR